MARSNPPPRSEPLSDLTEAELNALFKRAAKAVASVLPKGTLFTLLGFGKDGIGQYVSNASRREVILTLRETADRLEQRQTTPRFEFPD